MTISLTSEPDFTPPRVRVDVAVPSGMVMQSVTVYRETAAGRQRLRQQPEPGFDSRSVFDYEMPYETALTYSWEAEYVDPADAEPTFSEPWTNLAAWGGDVGIASVSGGRVTLAAYLGGQYIAHVPTGSIPWDRLSIGGILAGPTGLPIVSVHMGGYVLDLTRTAAGKLRVEVDGSGPSFAANTAISADQPFEVLRTSTGFLVRGLGGDHSVPRIVGEISGVYIQGSTNGQVRVGPITAQSNPVLDVVEESTDPVTMVSDHAWMIHPASPLLSVPLNRGSTNGAGIRSVGSVEQTSTTTLHRVLGRSRPVPVASGPRDADSLVMTIASDTSDMEMALRALLADETPLLIRVPASWEIGFHDDFYAVGNIAIERLVQMPGRHQRIFTLPLIAVDSPAVTQQNAGWSYAAVAAEFATYTAVFNAYASYADLMIDNRKPGY